MQRSLNLLGKVNFHPVKFCCYNSSCLDLSKMSPGGILKNASKNWMKKSRALMAKAETNTLRTESPSIFPSRVEEGTSADHFRPQSHSALFVTDQWQPIVSRPRDEQTTGSGDENALPTSSTIHIEHAPNSNFSATQIKPLP